MKGIDQIIPPSQTAYEKCKSVNHNLLALIEDITKDKEERIYGSL